MAIIDTGSAARPATGTDWQRRYVAAIGKGLPALETEHRTRGSAASMRTAGTRRLELCLELLDDGVARGDCRSTHLLDSGAAPFLSLRAQHWHTPSSSGRTSLKDGLLGLHLLPADLAGQPTLNIDREPGNLTTATETTTTVLRTMVTAGTWTTSTETTTSTTKLVPTLPSTICDTRR